MTFLKIACAVGLLSTVTSVPAAVVPVQSIAAPAIVCDLNEGDHARDEFAHCTNVVVGFAEVPGLGDTSTVEVSLTSVGNVGSGIGSAPRS